MPIIEGYNSPVLARKHALETGPLPSRSEPIRGKLSWLRMTISPGHHSSLRYFLPLYNVLN